MLMELIQHMVLQLLLIVAVAVFRFLKWYVDKFAEEIVILDDLHICHAVKFFLLEMLLEAAGDGTGLRCHLSVQEVVAPLQGPLKKAAPVVADTGGHVVGCDIR